MNNWGVTRSLHDKELFCRFRKRVVATKDQIHRPYPTLHAL